MLKVQLPGFESAQFLPQWPKPFLSGYGSAPLTIWPRHSPFQKQNYSIRSTLRKDNKPIPQPIDHPTSRKNFPPDFIFGTASSAYQYEGAAFEDGKGESNWDYFTRICPEKIKDGSNGVIAVDAYHKYKEDVALMKNLGVNAYRFSIAWTRILPNGKLSGGVNKAGIQYYNNLINELLLNGIQPFVTLFHWDVPHALEDEYGGFLSDQIIKDFKDFTDVCFKEFGDRVKFWITMNEPWTFTIFGYDQGTLRPGKADNRGTKPYVVVHNMLLAHAAVVDTYRKKYKETQNGQIGITLIYSWMIPYSENPADVAASQRASDFMLGWFMDPIARGEYPQSMQELVGPRLPKFNQEQSEMLKGSYDFIGLNYYTAIYTQDFTPSADNPCYTTDSHANLTSVRNGVPIGIPTAAELIYIYPEGLLAALNYIKEKYNNPVIYITENGTPDDSKLPKEQSLKDVKRKNALVSHLNNLLMAIKTGVDVRGYFVWSLLDCFEWGAGYTMRFGMHYVDFNDGLKRTQKDSALWFQNFLKEN